MGQLIDGVWHDTATGEVKKDGSFNRAPSQFQNWVTVDGTPGPTGRGGFVPEAGRYHLYVSLACPWSHRASIYLKLMGLEDAIDVSVVHPVNLSNGWEFGGFPGATEDLIGGAEYLHQVYQAADPKVSGKATIPVLWDRETATIVSNESSDIIRMLGGAFAGLAKTPVGLLPEEMRDEIDALNARVYTAINNGVYRTGFAQSQEAYEAGIAAMFEMFAELDERLADRRFLMGYDLLEPDIRLFVTMIRFEPVYYFHFKCNLRPLSDFPNLRRHARDVLNSPGVRETVNMDHIVKHYYLAHRHINPRGIIPAGAWVDLDGPFWGEGSC